MRRFDCILEPTKDKVMAEFEKLKGKPEKLAEITESAEVLK